MTTSLRSLGLTTMLSALLAVSASAQSGSTPTETRPATTTADGDTGLWYVPTAEVLTRGKWSASGYRTGFNDAQGFSNIANFPLTFGVGVARGLEAFASFRAVTRIDRDIRPLFINDPEVGGPVPRYPYVTQPWTGNQLGDLLVGLKFSLMSEQRGQPAALAVRGSVKLPTGDKEGGASTGKMDSFIDLIVSKEFNGLAEIAGYGGGAFRGSPDDVTQSNGLRWGAGVGFPSRSPLRITAEVNGERPFDDNFTVSTPIRAVDNTSAFGAFPLTQAGAATVGATLQLPNGFFVGAAMSKSLSVLSRDGFGADSEPDFDSVDFQFRIGFHPGVPRGRGSSSASGSSAAAPAVTPPAAPANRPPTLGGGAGAPAAGGAPSTGIAVTRDGAPATTVAPGDSLTLTANASDPDGDTLTYRWTAPVGTFSTPDGRTTQWTAPADFEGQVPITVTVTDGKGGSTSETTMVNVVRPRPVPTTAAAAPVAQLNFEDVYFDFDRSTLRPEALRLLDDAIAKLQANPTRNMIIEGHTCNIGTAEYNLALGDRRARSVMQYLTSRGVPANRLETRSYGEEQPKFDNAREETRRLNRRAALVITVQ